MVLAATNRPEILDPALLRPGRFDREVTIPLPNVTERAAILAVHCRGKKLAPDVDLDAIARGTPGLLRRGPGQPDQRGGHLRGPGQSRDVLTAADFDAARDRIILGRRESSNVLLPEEKHAVAVHESGHALVAALSEHADPVAKVTILPAGQALGVTEQLPLVERHMYGEDYLHDSLDGPARRPGGGAGGARPGLHRRGQRPGRGDRPGHQDGQGVRPVQDARARSGTRRAARCSSAAAGPACPAARSPRRPRRRSTGRSPSCSARPRSGRWSCSRGHRSVLDALTNLLLEDETVDGSEVYRLAGLPDRSATTPSMTPATTVAPRAVATADAGHQASGS